jgi:hypothetical protein
MGCPIVIVVRMHACQIPTVGLAAVARHMTSGPIELARVPLSLVLARSDGLGAWATMVIIGRATLRRADGRNRDQLGRVDNAQTNEPRQSSLYAMRTIG